MCSVSQTNHQITSLLCKASGHQIYIWLIFYEDSYHQLPHFSIWSPALVCQGVSDLAVKKRVESRRNLAKIAENRFPDARLFPLDSEQDTTLLLRHMGSQKQRKLGFRSRRPHLLAQQVSYTPHTAQETGGAPTGLGTLRVSGYVRGCAL